jgi:hypothetical protein
MLGYPIGLPASSSAKTGCTIPLGSSDDAEHWQGSVTAIDRKDV